jgi:hypothetical protein
MGAEPFNLRERTVPRGRLFTCGRPGRGAFGAKRRPVPRATILAWVAGLPAAPILHLVSLLGWKADADRYSEFSYYPFRSETERDRRPNIQEWLEANAGRRIVVHEFPTEDRLPLPAETIKAVAARIAALLADGQTVVVVDSAGVQRTGAVYEALRVSDAGGDPGPASRLERGGDR